MSSNKQPGLPTEVSYNEAVEASKKYFDGDDLAATVWVSKYALKDSYGHIYEKSPREMHERIAAEIERIEKKYPNPMNRQEVFELLDHFRYIIPQGGPDDRYRQQLPSGFAFELLRHRPQESGRLLRRHLPHGRGAGATDEAARRRGARPFAHPPHRQSGAQLGAHLDGYRALHGALLELDARSGPGRSPRSADAHRCRSSTPTQSVSSTPKSIRAR